MYHTKVVLKNPSKVTGEGKLMIEITFKHQGNRERIYIPTQEKIGLQPNTIHKNFKFILLFLNQLRKEEVIKTDKFKKLDYPREVETNTIVLEKEEVKLLIQHQPQNLRLSKVKDLFLILIYTGLRFGDGVRISKRWVSI